MRALLLALAALLFTACAGPSLDDAAAPTVELAAAETTEAAEATEEPAEAGCVVTFTPDAALAAETALAAARWSAATGCDIRVGEGGVRLRLVADRMLTPQGTEGHGRTYCPKASCRRSEVVIDVAADHDPATVGHEMGHALGATTSHVEEETEALMFHTGGDGAIVAADLVYVCDALDCAHMTPEA